jgi:hypothetical protein
MLPFDMDIGEELRFQSSRTKLVLMERVGGGDGWEWESYMPIDLVRSADGCGEYGRMVAVSKHENALKSYMSDKKNQREAREMEKVKYESWWIFAGRRESRVKAVRIRLF